MKKIFVINPGSTSTKLALYHDSKLVWKTTLMHSADDISKFAHPIDQLDYRNAQMYAAIEEAGIDGGFDAVIARGGLLQPTPGGVYVVDEGICHDLIHSPNEHACNLGALMANELAHECGCPALIADPEMYDALLDIDRYLAEPRLLLPWIMRCIEIKTGITTRDPKEKGERKILNFGHTAGHALESFALINGHPIPHGIAVAHGLLWEMIVSATAAGSQHPFPSSRLYPYAAMLKEYFPAAGVKCTDIDQLINLMRHDKKNASPDRINFTLLSDIGTPQWDQFPSEDDIRGAFEIYGDLTGQL